MSPWTVSRFLLEVDLDFAVFYVMFSSSVDLVERLDVFYYIFFL